MKHKVCYNAIFLGDYQTGKTSIIMKLTQNEFQENVVSTVGVEFFNYNDFENDIYSSNVSIKIYDTAGQERYRSLVFSLLRRCNIIFFVYDITKKSTFDSIANEWISHVRDNLDKFEGILIGNKSDLYESEEVREEEARNFAEKNGLKFFYVSAKSGEGIENIRKCFNDYVDNHKDELMKKEHFNIEQNTTPYTDQEYYNFCFDERVRLKLDKGNPRMKGRQGCCMSRVLAVDEELQHEYCGKFCSYCYWYCGCYCICCRKCRNKKCPHCHPELQPLNGEP